MGGWISVKCNRLRTFANTYLSSLLFKITGPLGTIFWIGSSIWTSEIAVVALLIHVLPPTVYFVQNRPFGVTIEHNHSISGDNGPDVLLPDDGRAVMRNGHCKIVGKVVVHGLNSFELRIKSTDGITAELRDIPLPEHIYNKKENTLICTDVSRSKFRIIFDIYDRGYEPPMQDTLIVHDSKAEREVLFIDVIRGT